MQISSIISKKTSSLATTAAVTAAENKIPNINNLLKKRKYYDAKISDIENKYFTTSDYRKFRRDILHAKINEKEVIHLQICYCWIHKQR